MKRMTRSCLQSLLKLVNSVIGLVGMGMILYALWMIRQCYRDAHFPPPIAPESTNPSWFIYAFLGLGIILCLMTCSGHIAAETANGHCLSCYMLCIFLLIILEAAITADIFLNINWEEDFPLDPTGKFDELMNFVRTNSEMCKWLGLSIAFAQIISILLALVLKAIGPDPGIDYDSDDDFVPTRLPLLRNHAPQFPYLIDSPQNNDSWTVRIDNKIN